MNNQKKINVLVTDDDNIQLEIIKRVLKIYISDTYIWNLFTATNIQSAREIIISEEFNNEQQVAIIDWMLPDGEGIELVTDFGDKLPIIIMTGAGDEKLATKSIKEGAVDYIVKSRDSHKNIVDVIISSLDFWHKKIAKQKVEVELALKNYAIDSAINGILILDISDNMNIIYSNYSAAKLINKNINELIGTGFKALFSPLLFNNNLSELIFNIGEGLENSIELEVNLSPNECQWYEFSISLVKIGKKYTQQKIKINHVLVTIKNITKRRKNEIELIESEQKYKTLVDSSLVSICKYTLDGELLFANMAFCKLLGYKDFDEMKSNNTLSLYKYPEERAPFLEKLKKLKRIEQHELDIVTKDNQIKNVILSETIDNHNIVSSVIVDLTYFYSLKAKLIESENKFKILYEDAPFAISILDNELNVKECNAAHLKITGYEEKVLFGNSLLNFEHFNIINLKIINNLKSDLDNGVIIHDFITKFKKSDGEIIDIQIDFVPLKINDINYIVAFAKDITLKLRHQKEIEELNQSLESKVKERTALLNNARLNLEIALTEEQEHNKMKTKFVAMVSHEYRNPLQVIMSNTYLLNKYYEHNMTDKFNEGIQNINRNVNKMLKLMEDVLTLGKTDKKITEADLKAVNTKELIDEVCRDISYISKKKIFFETHFSQNVEFKSVRGILNVIMTNLISNAVKYTKSDEIKIIINSKINKDGSYYFSVKDYGIGIPLQDQKMLFQSFHRASNTEDITGTGLGLHILLKCINNLKGELNFNSKENKGSQFSFTLPVFKD